MKKKYILILFTLISAVLHAQGFNSVHSPDGINVYAVGDSGKIYKSSNSGNNWFSYSYTSNNLKTVHSKGNTVWFAGDSGKVYKADLTMNTITLLNAGQLFTINSIFFVNNSTGYLCGDNGKIFKSTNGGDNWNLKTSGIGNIKLNSISFLDSQNGIVAGNNGKIYRTTNGGSVWIEETSFTNSNLLDIKYFPDGIISAGENGTLVSKQNNSSWSVINTRTNSDIRGVSGISVQNVHICGGGGFIRNNKNGSTKFLNFEINPMLANLVDIYFCNSDTGFAVSSLNKAVIRTTNGGLNWELPPGAVVSMNWVAKTPNTKGIGNTLCPHPSDRNSIFVVYGTKVYVTRDKGDTWILISTITVGTRAHSFYVCSLDTNIWLAAMENYVDCVVRSTDYGVTWTSVISQDFGSYGQPLEMDQNDPSIFYFAPSNDEGNGIFRSTDTGATFNLLTTYNNPDINQPCDLIVMWDSSSVLFMGDDGSDIYKSTNSALSWTKVKPESSGEVPSMCNSVFDISICYATTFSSYNVFRTTNYGDNWNIVSTNPGSGWGSDMCREDPTVVMTGRYGAETYLSTNGGANFFTVSSGLIGGLGGAGILVADRNTFLNMMQGKLFKLEIKYNVIDSTVYVSQPSLVNINLKVFPEGLYNSLSELLSRRDTISVYLRSNNAPYSLIDSSAGVIDSLNFSGIFSFRNTISGTYYIVIKHHNSIETWSRKDGEFLISNGSIYDYDFSDSKEKAFGNNLVQIDNSPLRFAVYSGDVNQDETIDASDLSIVENDVAVSLSGYFTSDLNGDNFADASDLSIVDNNASNSVSSVLP